MPTIVIFPRFVVRGARLPRLAPRRSVGASRGICRGRVPAGLTADNLAEVLIIQEALRERVDPLCLAGLAGAAMRGFVPAMTPAVHRVLKPRSDFVSRYPIGRNGQLRGTIT